MTHIVETNNLTEAQVKQIRALEQHCRAFDGTVGDLWLSSEFNRHREMPCFFLLHIGELLQGVLTIFAPASAPAEISALVRPEYRRRGGFTAMLCQAKQQLGKFESRDIQLVHETKSEAGRQMIAKWNIAPHHGEYVLTYNQNGDTTRKAKDNLTLIEAGQSDFEQLCSLNKAIFGGTDDGIAQMLQTSISSENIRCFKALLHDNLIGVCSVNHINNERYLFGFGIHPSVRGQGCGRAVLGMLTKRLTEENHGDIILEVDSANTVARALYKTSGFRTKTRYDYYERDISDICDKKYRKI